MRLPRVMFAAPSSGSGKTLVTCGVLQALVNRGLQVASFKCGPDYIDPMFHTRVIGTPSRNLDTYFAEPEMVRYLFGRSGKNADISVMEGVMGFYDGVAGLTKQASSWDLAHVTQTPVILIVNARGMSLSVVNHIRGFLTVPVGSMEAVESDEPLDCQIRGVILNQVSAMMYPELKREIEYALPVKVFGYVPKVEDCVIESRHLGLVTPGEIEDLKGKLQRLSEVLEKSLALDEIIAMAEQAEDLNVDIPEKLDVFLKKNGCCEKTENPVRIAVAKDEAFCFYYEDNLDLLRQMGAELVEFSPIWDKALPEQIDGLLLGGGYPELYARELSENVSMKESILDAVKSGMPYLAECGGFMYLHETMEDMESKAWNMVGVVKGHVHRTQKLGRFGYIQLTANEDQIFGETGCQIRAHEFHYFDSSNNGTAFHATKPYRKRSWDCILAGNRSAVGFPHLYYYSNPEFAGAFLKTCKEKWKHE